MSPAPQNWQSWQIDFGPVSGAAGTTTTIVNNPQCLFRGEKVIASDGQDGTAVRVTSLFVGNQAQRPALNGSTLAAFFGVNALGNGVRWKTCEKGLTIAVGVSFVRAATFDLSVFGSAVI